jgi:uncharacterized DUF497 family protein
MLRFDWDDAKNESNRAKHGVTFETAKLVFDDPELALLLDRVVGSEIRWHAIGFADDVLVTVVHTYPAAEDGDEDLIRIISARKATASERRIYAKKNA